MMLERLTEQHGIAQAVILRIALKQMYDRTFPVSHGIVLSEPKTRVRPRIRGITPAQDEAETQRFQRIAGIKEGK